MSEGRKSLLLIVIFTLVIGGWSYFYNTTYDRNMAELTADKLSSQQAIEQMAELVAKEQEIMDFLAKDYHLIIPKVSGLANLHDYIYATASKNNIELSPINFNTLRSNDTTKISSVEIDYTASGKYLDVRAFLQDMYQSERLFKLVDWSWQNSADGSLEIALVYTSFFHTKRDAEFLELPKLDVYEPAGRVNPI